MCQSWVFEDVVRYRRRAAREMVARAEGAVHAHERLAEYEAQDQQAKEVVAHECYVHQVWKCGLKMVKKMFVLILARMLNRFETYQRVSSSGSEKLPPRRCRCKTAPAPTARARCCGCRSRSRWRTVGCAGTA